MLKFENNLNKGAILQQQLISTCSMLCDDWLWNDKQHQPKIIKFENDLNKGAILQQQLISTCSTLCDDWLWNDKQHQPKIM